MTVKGSAHDALIKLVCLQDSVNCTDGFWAGAGLLQESARLGARTYIVRMDYDHYSPGGLYKL